MHKSTLKLGKHGGAMRTKVRKWLPLYRTILRSISVHHLRKGDFLCAVSASSFSGWDRTLVWCYEGISGLWPFSFQHSFNPDILLLLVIYSQTFFLLDCSAETFRGSRSASRSSSRSASCRADLSLSSKIDFWTFCVAIDGSRNVCDVVFYDGANHWFDQRFHLTAWTTNIH